MGAVNLDAVKSEGAGIRGGAGKGIHRRLDLGLRHRLGKLLAGLGKARRTMARHFRVGGLGGVAHHADMPELRHDLAASVMDFLHHTFPAFQGFVAPELRHIGVTGCNRRVDCRSFCDDKAAFGLGAAPVVGGDLRARNAARRLGAGHGRHDDPIGQREPLERERLEQRRDGTAHEGLLNAGDVDVRHIGRLRPNGNPACGLEEQGGQGFR